jgi:hypothetical protein
VRGVRTFCTCPLLDATARLLSTVKFSAQYDHRLAALALAQPPRLSGSAIFGTRDNDEVNVLFPCSINEIVARMFGSHDTPSFQGCGLVRADVVFAGPRSAHIILQPAT